MATLVFGRDTLSARLERFDVTAPITFVLAGLLLSHGPLAFLCATPSKELIKELAEFTLALVLFSDASRVGLHELRSLRASRWLVEHGFDPSSPGREFDVLGSRM